MSGLSKDFDIPTVASTSQEGQKNRKLKVTLLSSEWRSSTHRDLSTINRELAIQLAKHSSIEVSVYLPQCSEEDRNSAASHDVQLVVAETLSGMNLTDCLMVVPDGHVMDCVVGHGVTLGKQVQVLRKHHHCKWIQVVHTAPEEHGMYKSISQGEQLQQTEVALCKKADEVLAIGSKLTDAYKRYLRCCQKEQNVFNLTPSIFSEFLNVKQATEERRTFSVMVIGSSDSSEDFILKGYDLAAQAIAELKDKSYQLKFLGAPRGKEDEIAEKLLQHGVDHSQLIIRSFSDSREVLADLFCEVDLAIMPTKTEGFGVTALEALSAGLPVLVSGNSGLGEALKEVPLGSQCVIESEDPKDWAREIKAVRQKKRSVRLAETKFLHEKYLEVYSWEEPIRSLVERMHRLVFEGSSGGHSFHSPVEYGQCPLPLASVTEGKSVQQRGPSQGGATNIRVDVARAICVGCQTAQREMKSATTEEILNSIAKNYLQTTPPQSPEEHNHFITYLREMRVVLTGVSIGSLLITVKCDSLESLERLWEEHSCGHLDKMVQDCFVTEKVLKELHLVELKLKTTMDIEEYNACKLFFERNALRESTTENPREMKGEIQMVKQKLDDLMSGPPPNKRPRMEGKIRSGCQTDEDNGDPPECSVHFPDLSDLPSSGTDQCPSQPDVLLLTVKDCEFLSCYAYLQNPLKHYVHGLGYVYFGIVCDEEYEPVKVALMKCYEGSVGPGCSLTAVKDAVTCLKPKGVISVGYCSGLNREKAKLGDVVVCAKLTTYAPKMVLDTEEQSTGTRTVVSRNFLNLIKNVADGWKAPLKNPETREVEAHAGGEFLSGPERISTDWQRAKLLEAYPHADAIELEGEGVFTAAFDLGIEWLLVKGIADFADGTDTKGSWKRFASIMAASVVFHLLSDPNVFKDWPHYKGSSEFQMMKRKPDDLTSGLPLNKRPRVEDAFDPVEMIENIRQLYKTREGTINLLPWCEDLNFSFGDIYTRLKVIYKDKTRGEATDRAVTMSEIFNPHEECEEPRVVLIEGKPGMGKTTYCKKVVFDWATQNHAAGNYFAKFLMVLLIKCREVQSSLWEAIDDQLLPRDISDDQRERFFDFIRHSHSKVLLILDGLDEVSEKELPVFSEIIQGRVLSKCRVVVTARHEVGVKVRKYCDTLLEVEGFTDGDARSFINKYFKTRKNLAEELSDRLSYDRNLGAMAANPLNCALFCLVWEEFNGAFPESRSQLYMDIVECVLRRYMYRAKKQLPANGEYLVELYESQLNHLGSIALKGLLEGNLDFDEKELRKHKESDLPELGFLSVQPGGSKLRPTRRCGFLHKTFQEFFAALNLASQLIKKEISTDHVAEDVQYRGELKEVLLFTFGILAMRCKETAENLAKSMATQWNQENDDESAALSMVVILECISECKNDNNFDVKLARTLGPCLQIEAINVFSLYLGEAEVLLLANVLITNTSVRELMLDSGNIHDAGAAALARCFKENTSLTKLYLNENTIGEAGAAALADCLKENTSLTELHLASNGISDNGAAALANCLKENTALTVLVLCSNGISDDGSAALAECLKENTSLTKLHLSSNVIGYNGAAALAECFKENTSLKDLNLSYNDIDEAGVATLLECLKENTSLQILHLDETVIGNSSAATLAKCLKENTSVTELSLDENLIGEAGAAALAECLKENSSLEWLTLNRNDIGDSGAAALAECLKENTFLTALHLEENNIGKAGAAALADCLKENTSLTWLNLSSNGICEAGVSALAECLKENTSLLKLNLGENSIGKAGAAALTECLKENSSLKFLNLQRNNIGNSGLAALAKCLKENTSLTHLLLNENSIGEAGAAALADCLKENTFLTILLLEKNNIGDAGVAALAECLKKNSSLKLLEIRGNNIGKAGAASLAECLKENTSVSVVYRMPTSMKCARCNAKRDGVM